MYPPPPNRPLPPRRTSSGLSRRDMLAVLGLAGAGTAAACACAGLSAAYLLSRDDSDAPRTVFVTATPDPIASSGPPIVPRESWGAEPVDLEAPFENGAYSPDNPEGYLIYPEDLASRYTTLIIHHSVIDEGDDAATVREAQRLHQTDRGWADVGYHYLVGRNGLIFQGRDIHARGVHTAGYNNGTVGLCLIGNFMEVTPTDAQAESARRMVLWLAALLDLTHIGSHRDFNGNTQCPGDFLVGYVPIWAREAGLTVGIDGYVAPTPEPTSTASTHQPGCACCGGVV